MLRAKRMSTAQLVKPRIITAKATLESIFNRLASNFGLTVEREAKPCIDLIKALKASGSGHSLQYIRSITPDLTEGEAISYLGRPLGWLLHVFIDGEESSLSCTVPSDKLMKYRLFLTDRNKKYHDLADKVAVGSFDPEIKVVGRKCRERVCYKLNLTDFSEVYEFLANHIRH